LTTRIYPHPNLLPKGEGDPSTSGRGEEDGGQSDSSATSALTEITFRRVQLTFRLLDLAQKTALPNAAASPGGLALELKDIKAIIDLMRKNELSVFEMEKDGFKLKLQKGVSEKTVLTPLATSVALPVAAPAAAAPTAAAPAETAAAPPQKPTEILKDIVSPMVGTFYRAASPDSPTFVEVLSEVNEETVVCIIEAMKVMNEIKAETTGVIAEVVAENGKPVQFGQVLFRVR
jgi:acetyl-CoA carboxylase biotin carboxyl carrier protein